MYIKLIAKPLAFALFTVSGSLLDRRVAFRSAREAAFGPSRRPTAGFRRLRWRAHLHQKRRNYPVDPHGRQASRIVAALPRQPQVRNTSACQSQLGEGGYHQPCPPIRLLGVAHPRRRPSHALLQEAEGVLQIEAPDVSAPEQIEVRRHPLRAVPPQPQNTRLASPLAAGQPLYLHQDERTDHDGQQSAATLSFVVLDLRVQLREGAHAAVDAGSTYLSGVAPTGPREICGSFRDFRKVNAWKMAERSLPRSRPANADWLMQGER